MPTAAVQRGPNGTFVYIVKDDETVTVRPVTVDAAERSAGRDRSPVCRRASASSPPALAGSPRAATWKRPAPRMPAKSPPPGAERRRDGPAAKRGRERAATDKAGERAPRVPIRATASPTEKGDKAGQARSSQSAGKLQETRRARRHERLLPFIHRPIATSLLGIAVMLGGMLGYLWLPVSSLPQVDFPTIQVTTQLPGASPDTIASLVTAPLERNFGQIPSLAD